MLLLLDYVIHVLEIFHCTFRIMAENVYMDSIYDMESGCPQRILKSLHS